MKLISVVFLVVFLVFGCSDNAKKIAKSDDDSLISV